MYICNRKRKRYLYILWIRSNLLQISCTDISLYNKVLTIRGFLIIHSFSINSNNSSHTLWYNKHIIFFNQHIPNTVTCYELDHVECIVYVYVILLYILLYTWLLVLYVYVYIILLYIFLYIVYIVCILQMRTKGPQLARGIVKKSLNGWRKE